jgi:hypothetical protein
VLGLDPVESRPGGVIFCDVVTQCPPAISAIAALTVPVLLLGETMNASGGVFGMSCAPENANFNVLYNAAKVGTTSVEVLGATHMSFHSEPNCFPLCTLCGSAQVDNGKVLALAQAYAVAFFERHLAGDLEMDAFITGDAAKTRYVSSGLAVIRTSVKV